MNTLLSLNNTKIPELEGMVGVALQFRVIMCSTCNSNVLMLSHHETSYTVHIHTYRHTTIHTDTQQYIPLSIATINCKAITAAHQDRELTPAES